MLNRRSFQVIRGEETINLPLKEFELLFMLANQPGQIFTREQLIIKIWGVIMKGMTGQLMFISSD